MPEADLNALESRLSEIFHRSDPPEEGEYLRLTRRACQVLAGEPESLRPHSRGGLPGGLIYLDKDLPTIIVPDLHARMDFLLAVLDHAVEEGARALDRLAQGSLQIVCLGDGFHAEGRAADRWQAALEEFKFGYERHRHMDQEMRESLGVMEMVMELKTHFPQHFHFLKGNHENINNERGEGNYPFLKFANEGLMVLIYMDRFYGEELLADYGEFEKRLPLLAVGKSFLISHAEPERFFDREELIEYRSRPEVVYGLTWTDNEAAEEGSVQAMLSYYLDQTEECYHFGGHRPVRGGYRLRAGGRYVQIHDPNRFVIALIPADRSIDLDRDIVEIENRGRHG